MSGAIVWFTGLPGAGKSTLARAVGARVMTVRDVEILDGDEFRTHLSKGLGFSREDRDLNIRRIGFVARLLARHGVCVMVAAISPYAETRDDMRRLATIEDTPFVEVFVDAPLASLVTRDVKGLYARALAGDLPHFTGVSDPYEPPTRPETVVRTDQQSIDQSVETILAALVAARLLPP